MYAHQAISAVSAEPLPVAGAFRRAATLLRLPRSRPSSHPPARCAIPGPQCVPRPHARDAGRHVCGCVKLAAAPRDADLFFQHKAFLDDEDLLQNGNDHRVTLVSHGDRAVDVLDSASTRSTSTSSFVSGASIRSSLSSTVLLDTNASTGLYASGYNCELFCEDRDHGSCVVRVLLWRRSRRAAFSAGHNACRPSPPSRCVSLCVLMSRECHVMSVVAVTKRPLRCWQLECPTL